MDKILSKTTIDLERHDRHQLEIKINYPSHHKDEISIWSQFLSFVSPKTVEYNTDVYFLIPPAAGIGSGDYREEDFYADMRSYTRLTAPNIDLEYLLDEERNRCWCFLDKFLTFPIIYPRHKRQLSIEIRLLSCMFRESVYQFLRRDHLKKKEIKILVKQSIAFLNKWRHYLDAIHDVHVAESLKKETMSALRYVDEEISIQIEFLFVRLCERFQITPKQKRRMITFLNREKIYRKNRNYHSREQDLINGNFLLRIGMLKKYVSSVLFLEKEVIKTTDWSQHLALAIAAGLAMAWAVVAQLVMFFYLGLELQQSMSGTLITAFFIIAIFSYILKDRIKATVGPYLRKKVKNKARTPDRKFQFLFPQAQINVAIAEERFHFLHADNVSTKLKQAWSVLEEKQLAVIVGGDILHYHRDISVAHDKMRQFFKQYSGVSDVLRIHLERWIRTFDEPIEDISTLDEYGNIASQKASRVYVVYAAVRVCKNLEEKPFKLYKILLSQKGGTRKESMQKLTFLNQSCRPNVGPRQFHILLRSAFLLPPF